MSMGKENLYNRFIGATLLDLSYSEGKICKLVASTPLSRISEISL
jgi:hypothetical protein